MRWRVRLSHIHEPCHCCDPDIRRESVELRWGLYCMHVTASLDRRGELVGPESEFGSGQFKFL